MRNELCQATAAVHERLHHVPVFAALAAGGLDRAEYASLLGRLYGFHAPFEAAVERAGPPVPPGRWRRAHLLRSDMTALGRSEAAIKRLPRYAVPGGVWSPARAMGCLYVIEGSTLGLRASYNCGTKSRVPALEEGVETAETPRDGFRAGWLVAA